MLLTESLWITLSEEFIKMFAGISQLVGTGNDKRIIRNINNTFKIRHLCRINLRSNDITYKQQLRFAMVYDVVYLVCSKLMQDRYSNSSISESGKKSNSPTCAIATTYSDSITFFYSTILKKYMKFFYFSCNVFILQRYTLVVRKRIKIPVLDYALFDQGIKTWY